MPSPLEHFAESEENQTPSARKTVVVAGPSTSTTIPGIIVSQIVQALLGENPVTRIEVDLGTDFAAGIHRFMDIVCCVSRGMGSSRFMRIRFFSMPEAILLTLKP